MAKAKQSTVKKTATTAPAAPAAPPALVPAQDPIVTSEQDAMAALEARCAAAEAECRRLHDHINMTRHEQVAAYRNGRNAAVEALREVVAFVEGEGVHGGPVKEAFAPILNRARHAITRAEVML